MRRFRFWMRVRELCLLFCTSTCTDIIPRSCPVSTEPKFRVAMAWHDSQRTKSASTWTTRELSCESEWVLVLQWQNVDNKQSKWHAAENTSSYTLQVLWTSWDGSKYALNVRKFTWWSLKDDWMEFVKSWVHFLSTKGGNRIPRPLVVTLHATKPNEILYVNRESNSKVK